MNGQWNIPYNVASIHNDAKHRILLDVTKTQSETGSNDATDTIHTLRGWHSDVEKNSYKYLINCI